MFTHPSAGRRCAAAESKPASGTGSLAPGWMRGRLGCLGRTGMLASERSFAMPPQKSAAQCSAMHCQPRDLPSSTTKHAHSSSKAANFKLIFILMNPNSSRSGAAASCNSHCSLKCIFGAAVLSRVYCADVLPLSQTLRVNSLVVLSASLAEEYLKTPNSSHADILYQFMTQSSRNY